MISISDPDACSSKESLTRTDWSGELEREVAKAGFLDRVHRTSMEARRALVPRRSRLDGRPQSEMIDSDGRGTDQLADENRAVFRLESDE